MDQDSDEIKLNFDLNFNILSDDDDNGEDPNPPTVAEMKEIPVAQSQRFIPLTDGEIDRIASERATQSTKYNTIWGVKTIKSEY